MPATLRLPAGGARRRTPAGRRMTRGARAPGRAAGRRTLVPGGEPLRIAMLAPPWMAVPPPGYGGVEWVVSALTEALVRQGHAVTLFCAPGSVSRAEVVPVLEHGPSGRDRAVDPRGRPRRPRLRRDRARATARTRSTSSTTTAGSPPSRWPTGSRSPSSTRSTGAFDASTTGFYRRHGHKAALVAISDAQLASAPARRPRDLHDPEPDRRRRVAAARGEGRLPALGRAHDDREGAAPGDRRRPRRRRAAASWRASSSRARSRTSRREVAPHLDGDRVTLRRRGRRRRQARALRRCDGRC